MFVYIFYALNVGNCKNVKIQKLSALRRFYRKESKITFASHVVVNVRFIKNFPSTKLGTTQ